MLHQQCAMKIQQSGRPASTSEGCPSFIHQLCPFYPYVLSLKCRCPPAASLTACTSQTLEFFFLFFFFLTQRRGTARRLKQLRNCSQTLLVPGLNKPTAVCELRCILLKKQKWLIYPSGAAVKTHSSY